MSFLKSTFYPLLKLTLPLALIGFVQSAVWFFETIFLARLGPDILAAGSLASWLYGTVVVVIFGSLSSINVLVSHNHGAEDVHGIRCVIRDGLCLGMLLALPAFLLFWNMAPLFLLFGQSPTVVTLANAYLHAMAWGILPNILIMTFMEIIVGLGYARPIMLFSIVSVSLTIFFSFAFIFGEFGFPNLGIAGAGWGLTASNWITMFFLGGYVFLSQLYKPYVHALFESFKPSYFVELLHIGAPIGLMYCVEVTFFFVLTLLMGHFGAIVMAANQVALQYLNTLMTISFSTAQAITVRMGHLLGAGNKKLATDAAYTGILISTSIMLLAASVYWLFPTALISIDFDVHMPENQNLVRVAAHLLWVGAIFQVFETVRIALFGTLRALKDTRFTLFISILSFWGIALPLGYFLASRTTIGPSGLWWGMILGAAFSVVLLFWRFENRIKLYVG